MRKPILTSILASAVLAATAVQAATGPADEHSNRIILLGTRGGPVVDSNRSQPASLLVVDGAPYQIDAGEGVARQLVAAGFPVASIHNVFITHHHLDHTAGLEPLMSLDWIDAGLAGRKGPLVNVYGPAGTEFLVKAALNYLTVSQRIFQAGIPSLPAASTMFFGRDVAAGPVYQDARIKVTAVENTHFSHPSYGADGRKDTSLSYRFDTPKASVVFTGDTGPSEAVAALARGADVLVSEVYLPEPGASLVDTSSTAAVDVQFADHLAREHLSPVEVGKLAARAGVKTVILTHMVNGSSPERAKQLEDGVHEHFHGPVIVGHDLMEFDLDKLQAR